MTFRRVGHTRVRTNAGNLRYPRRPHALQARLHGRHSHGRELGEAGARHRSGNSKGVWKTGKRVLRSNRRSDAGTPGELSNAIRRIQRDPCAHCCAWPAALGFRLLVSRFWSSTDCARVATLCHPPARRAPTQNPKPKTLTAKPKTQTSSTPRGLKRSPCGPRIPRASAGCRRRAIRR